MVNKLLKAFGLTIVWLFKNDSNRFVIISKQGLLALHYLLCSAWIGLISFPVAGAVQCCGFL